MWMRLVRHAFAIAFAALATSIPVLLLSFVEKAVTFGKVFPGLGVDIFLSLVNASIAVSVFLLIYNGANVVICGMCKIPLPDKGFFSKSHPGLAIFVAASVVWITALHFLWLIPSQYLRGYPTLYFPVSVLLAMVMGRAAYGLVTHLGKHPHFILKAR